MKAIRNNTSDWYPKEFEIPRSLLEIIAAIEHRGLLDDQKFEFPDGDVWTWQKLRDYAINMAIGEQEVLRRLEKALKENDENLEKN